MSLGYVIYNPSVLASRRCIRTFWLSGKYSEEHIYISAWGFGVARFDRMGNSQEPQGVKRATVQSFTSLYNMKTVILRIFLIGSIRRFKTRLSKEMLQFWNYSKK